MTRPDPSISENPPEGYAHLKEFSDWVQAAEAQRGSIPFAPPGKATQAKLRQVLGFCDRPEQPLAPRTDQRWEKDGVSGELVSWSVGYGPRTEAWLLKPTGMTTPLPGVVALHDHGAFKYLGKEKIAEGPDDPPLYVRTFWDILYGGRSWANDLAREGFVVLVPDTFLWGSRRFPLSVMPPWASTAFGALQTEPWFRPEIPAEIGAYNFASSQHEHIIEKYCNLLGTTLAGVISHEDRIAANYLRSRPEVIPDRIGCAGLSGGGARAALLQATDDQMRATVIVGMMSTYTHLLDQHVATHTWLFFPAGWSRLGDWPDLAACRAPSPLLVQFDLEDHLFPLKGMQSAHERLGAHYAQAGSPESYTGEFYPGPHKFDLQMQRAAFGWLSRHLKG